MSEEKRDYPEWLDQELFSGLDGAPAEESGTARGGDETAPGEPAKKKASPDDEPVKKKKKHRGLKITESEASAQAKLRPWLMEAKKKSGAVPADHAAQTL